MDGTSFRDLFAQAWKMSFSYPIAFVFGSFVASATVARESIFSIWHRKSFEEFVEFMMSTSWREYQFFAVSALVIAFLIQVFGQSNLIVVLAERKRKYSWRIGELIRIFLRALFVECVANCFLIVVAIVFLSPPLFAFWYNQEAFGGAALMSLLAFLPIFFIVLFIRQFSLVYYILSPLHIKSAFERGAALFLKYFSRSIVFGGLLLVVSIIFTFFLNAVMLGTSALFDGRGAWLSAKDMGVLISFFSVAWFSVFQQSLWILFFKDLASPKDIVAEEKKEAIFDPGLPLA